MEQTENIQTPISPVNNVQNPHFSAKKLMVGIVLILVLATVFVVGMGYGSKNNKVVDIENKPVQSVTNDMEGWKTYTDDEYNFQTKYNPQSSPIINPYNKNDNLKLISFGTNPLKFSNGYELRVHKKYNLDDIKTEIINNYNTETINSTVEVTIDGIVWTKLNYRIFMTTDYVSVTTAFTNINENGFAITASSLDIDKILSTFKFVNNDLINSNTETSETVDLTLLAGDDWISATGCGMSYKIGSNFVSTVGGNPSFSSADLCSFVYEKSNFDYNFNVDVYFDYDGGSRREFYIKKQKEIGRNIESYVSVLEFKAGDNSGLILDYPEFRIYLVNGGSNKLVSIRISKYKNTDDIKKFLTSIISY